MRKVNNKKVIEKISYKSFRANRTRNVIAIIAIALMAMLFTTLFTVGIGTAENFQRQTMRQAGGDSHGVFKNITEEQYEKLSSHPLVKESADNRLVANTVENPEFLKRHMEVWYYPENFYGHNFVEIIDGKAPEKADEVLVDETSLKLLGMKAKAGQEITLLLEIREGQEPVERTFQISGVIKSDPALDVGFTVVSKAYLTEHQEELQYTYDQDGSAVGAIRMEVVFENSSGIQKKLDQMAEESGYSAEEGAENFVQSNANWAYISESTSGDPMTVAAIAGVGFLIVLTGYLIIYNIFQISVMKDIRFYGLLKTIGTTGKQIKKIIRRQALLLSVIGIPFGLLVGFFVGKAIVPMILSHTTMGNSDPAVSMNPWIFVGAAVFALVTVFISAGKPAKLAAKVSPVEAVRYTEGGKQTKKQKKTTDGGRISRMALSNLGRNKGKTVIVIVSLSLAIVLLNSIFTFTNAFDIDKYLSNFVSSDFVIANAKYFNSEYYARKEDIQESNLTESFIEACEGQEGFEKGGRIYAAADQIGVKISDYKVPEHMPVNEKGELCWMWNGEKVPATKLNEENYRVMYYGLDDFLFEKMEIYEGEKDLDVIRDKLATGNYLLYAVSTDDNGQVQKEDMVHQAGDKVILTFPNGEEREMEILSVIKENYYGLSTRYSEIFPYYTTSEVFLKDLPADYLMSYSFDVRDDREEAIQEFVKNYSEKAEPTMNYESKLKWLNEFESLKGMFTIIGSLLTFVVAVIGILNFINAILTSIVTRLRELAMLESIGMTKKQIVKMLTLEGLYYAGFTMGFSALIGMLMSVTVLRVLTSQIWFMKYQFVIWPMLLTFPLLLVLGWLVPKAAYRFQGKKSMIEQLKNAD